MNFTVKKVKVRYNFKLEDSRLRPDIRRKFFTLRVEEVTQIRCGCPIPGIFKARL